MLKETIEAKQPTPTPLWVVEEPARRWGQARASGWERADMK